MYDIAQNIETISTAQNPRVTLLRLPLSTSDIRFTFLIDSVDLGTSWQTLKTLRKRPE